MPGTGRELTYPDPGATRPAELVWAPPAGAAYRSFERTVPIGTGDAFWESASAALLSWGVKTRSGFRVAPAEDSPGQPVSPVSPGSPGSPRVRVGSEYRLIALLGPLRLREPVRVVAVVDTRDRRGFAYGTLEGHPVSGEEAFVLSRDGNGLVALTLRSLTRPGGGLWRLAFPLALGAQRWYRRRYQRAPVP
jgi:uncharacterized protein (UPF0548 family)